MKSHERSRILYLLGALLADSTATKVLLQLAREEIWIDEPLSNEYNEILRRLENYKDNYKKLTKEVEKIRYELL